jgi:hypothetical protein
MYLLEYTDEDKSFKNIALWDVMLYIWQTAVFVVQLRVRGVSQVEEKRYVMKRRELLSLKKGPHCHENLNSRYI